MRTKVFQKDATLATLELMAGEEKTQITSRHKMFKEESQSRHLLARQYFSREKKFDSPCG